MSPRPAAATPAAKITQIVEFFRSASLETAEIAFELCRTALNERRARKRAQVAGGQAAQAQRRKDEKTEAAGRHERELAYEAEREREEAAKQAGARRPTTPGSKPARPKKRKKPAGRKRDRLQREMHTGASGEREAEKLPEQHPIEEQAEPPEPEHVEQGEPDTGQPEPVSTPITEAARSGQPGAEPALNF